MNIITLHILIALQHSKSYNAELLLSSGQSTTLYNGQFSRLALKVDTRGLAQHMWTPPLTQVLHYSTLSMVAKSRYTFVYPGLPNMCLTIHEHTVPSSLQCFIHHNLYLNTSQELCDLAHSTSPMSVLGAKLEELPNDSRGLLKQLLRLFGQVNKLQIKQSFQ